MKYAIAADGNQMAGHFGHAPSFIVVDIRDGKTVSRDETPSPPHAPGRIPAFVKELGADCVVVGGIGGQAKALFSQLEIDQICGITGSIDEVIAALEAGTLEDGGDLCDHSHQH
ncbi:NifB/NifX family molybdenum-iron cluster-binding protein [Marispirochaeta sp.]|jgi:predicted Fe-Mo cluster-binding NifX family protein|uniref:NifB/NifX family molybdenum-iron cluster-binding protein n=1 Tax=Marispirochaeta sp. TaxID=2038653 RepID=UPI0029C652B3|nr:NifB/NifX family molybdenum-iron cluster-binding protein [Marispirochaeta sp.]